MAETGELSRINILMPALVPHMIEGTITRWLKSVGDFIHSGEVIAELETTWATMEIEAVDDGVLERIVVPSGTVKVNTLIATIITVNSEARKQLSNNLGSFEGTLRKLVDEAITERLAIPDAPESSSPVASLQVENDRRVFIVHGHDDAAKFAVSDFLRKADCQPIILHERPNKGRTIISKFTEEAAGVSFAVVLFTPDDEGGKAGATMMSRPRQNVVFELGFFIGSLGPHRVAALVKGNIEYPSDFDGVVYIPMDDAGHWQTTLAKELQSAGLKIDWDKLMRT